MNKATVRGISTALEVISAFKSDTKLKVTHLEHTDGTLIIESKNGSITSVKLERTENPVESDLKR